MAEMGAKGRAAAAEVKHRGEAARDRLRRLLDNGEVRYRLVNRKGEVRAGPPGLWLSAEGGSALRTGEVHIYSASGWCTYTGFLLIVEADLERACARLRQQAREAEAREAELRATAESNPIEECSERERRQHCHDWFVGLMAENQRPPAELPTKREQIEAAACRFQISKRAAESERGNAIRHTNNKIWSNPGPKSPQPEPDPRNDRRA
jgi:hypothetical protein